jgi:hypothetical protein
MKSLRMLSSSGFLVLALLAVCFSAGAASGEDSKGRLSSWDNLRSLTPGEEIRVVMSNVKSHEGKFEALGDDGITLRQKEGKQTLARKDILRVSRKTGESHRERNALIGAAIGAGLGLGGGLAADHAICTICPATPRYWALIGPPVVGLPGAAIGAVIPTGGWHDVYRAR